MKLQHQVNVNVSVIALDIQLCSYCLSTSGSAAQSGVNIGPMSAARANQCQHEPISAINGPTTSCTSWLGSVYGVLVTLCVAWSTIVSVCGVLVLVI